MRDVDDVEMQELIQIQKNCFVEENDKGQADQDFENNAIGDAKESCAQQDPTGPDNSLCESQD